MNTSNLLIEFPQLCKEWDFEKNTLPPQNFKPHSSKKVWWACAFGHKWEARIADRTRGTGCPYCSGKRPIVGLNDLATVYPNLALEWNYAKNKNLTPQDFLPHSGKKVFWICRNKHEWAATIDSRARGNGCPFCAGQKVIRGKNDLASRFPDLLAEWDFEKNSCSPYEIMAGSGQPIFWKCHKGHSFVLTPNQRTSLGYGCKICMNEIKTSFPEQAIIFYLKPFFQIENRYMLQKNVEIDIWLPEINLGIEYDGIYFHSSKDSENREQKKNLIAKNRGISLLHIKETRTLSSANKHCKVIYRDLRLPSNESLRKAIVEIIDYINCHYSRNFHADIDLSRDRYRIWSQYVVNEKSNCLSYTHPQIAQSWDYEKNGSLLPEHITAGSHKKVFWLCNNGHSFEASIYHRVAGSGCPYCSNQKVLPGFNDLATTHPELLIEWDYTRNLTLSPQHVIAGSPQKAFWICKYGHTYTQSIRKKINGQGCPYCSGKKVWKGFNDLASLYPQIAQEWNYARNENLTPDCVTRGSNKVVWWKCSLGHEWKQSIIKRVTRNSVCPVCRKLHKQQSRYEGL